MPTINQWFLDEFVPALGRTLLHSLWQGLIVAVLAAIILLCTRKTKAVIRYNSLLLLLGLAVATAVFTFVREYTKTASIAFTTEKISTSFVADDNTSMPVTSMVSSSENIFATLLSYFDRYALIVVAAWAFFFLIQLSKMAMGLHYIQRLQKQKKQLASEEWIDWLREKCGKWNLNKPVQLFESAAVNVPAAIGYFKPVILVPAGLLTGLPAAQVEAILLHELAHIRRKDYLVNLLQSIVDAVFFFNPAFIWLSAVIRRERENCCDEMVLQSSLQPQEYVQALLSFQSFHVSSSSYAMALDNGKGMLLTRVRRILLKENNTISKREASGLALALLLFCVGLFAFRTKDEQLNHKNSPEKKETTAISKKVNDRKVITTTGSVNSNLQDTVPPKKNEKPAEQKKIQRMMTNKVDDGKNKQEQVIAIDKEGNEYRIRKENNEIKKLELNQKEIQKEDYKQHQKMLDEIEQRQLDQKNKQQQGILRKQKAFMARQEAMNKRLIVLDSQRQKNKLAHLNRQHGLQEERIKKNQEKLQLHEKKMQERSQLFETPGRKILVPHNENSFRYQPKRSGLDPTLSSIYRDLKAQQLITDDSKFSFTLKDGELEVNGTVQPGNVYEIYSKKYLRNKGDRFSYSKDGGTTRTEVNLQ